MKMRHLQQKTRTYNITLEIGKCELHFEFNSTMRINAIRFSELIVESEYIGKNFLKMTPSGNNSYITFNTGSVYHGTKTICSEFDIPTTEDRVKVRSKKLGIYPNEKSMWLACQYQIGGWWGVDLKNIS